MLKNEFRPKDDFDVRAWEKAKNAATGGPLIDEARLKEMSVIAKRNPSQSSRSSDVEQKLIDRIEQQQKEINSILNNTNNV